MQVYIYQWICCDDNKINVRGYGLNEKNETICVHVNNFYPWLSIELKDTKNIENYIRLLGLTSFISMTR